MTVLDLCYGPGPEKHKRLRRSPHVPGPGGWEIDPEGFARYIEAGDWAIRKASATARRSATATGWSIERAARNDGHEGRGRTRSNVSAA
jgi:hypothetical protein